MDLIDIYKKQKEDIEAFNTLRDEVWANMKERHDKLIAAFQSKENLPKGYAANIDREIEDFNKEWSLSDGTRYAEMTEQHEKKIAEITGKPQQPEQKTQAQLTEREQLKQKFKDEMKAIEENNRLKRGHRMR